MLRPLSRRLNAIVLAVTFVGGGFGPLDLDALLYHSSRDRAPAETGHVDLPGGCGAHSEHCALNIATPVPQLAPAGSALGATNLAPDKPINKPVVVPRSAQPSFLHPSRAPPASAC